MQKEEKKKQKLLMAVVGKRFLSLVALCFSRSLSFLSLSLSLSLFLFLSLCLSVKRAPCLTRACGVHENFECDHQMEKQANATTGVQSEEEG